MKTKHVSLVALTAVAMLFGSCVYYNPYGYHYHDPYDFAYDSGEMWVASSYDVNGFPIFGYYYGRPVYGYTAAGAAIFTFAALTASCYVPHWGPAHWYHGSWRYPHHIHRVGAPPHFPHGHQPSLRPHGGLNAPIHRNPNRYFGGSPGGARPHMGGGSPGGARPHMGGGMGGGHRR